MAIRGIFVGDMEVHALGSYEKEQVKLRKSMEKMASDPNRSEKERERARTMAEHLRSMGF